MDSFIIGCHGSLFDGLRECWVAVAGAPNVLCGCAILHGQDTLVNELTCDTVSCDRKPMRCSGEQHFHPMMLHLPFCFNLLSRYQNTDVPQIASQMFLM